MANYSVYKDGDSWAAKRDDAGKAASKHDTQADARRAAGGYAGRSGGGEVSLHGVDGKIRGKDTIKPGHDPRDIPG